MSMNHDFIYSLLGGVLIGTAATLMLYLNGRVMGLSGIISGVYNFKKESILWRFFFIFGILVGAGLIKNFLPLNFLLPAFNKNFLRVLISGFLVGFGTVLGSGCTSGHGVCGISRLSVRSIVATLIFMMTAMICVSIFKKIGIL